MDPWSMVDYSRIIWGASMVAEKLPEVNPPSGRVPGRGLLALPILEARWRRNRGDIAKKGSHLGGFGGRCKYRGRGPPWVHAAPWRAPTSGRAGRAPGAWWVPSGPPSRLWKLPKR